MSSTSGSAGRALTNARVLPMTTPDAEAEAILWLGDRIAAVGTNDDIRRAAAEAGLAPGAIEDLGGRVVIPGFVDAHLHFQHVGMKALRPWLHRLDTRQAVLESVRRWLAENPGSSPVVGEGWDESNWPERIMLTRDELDSVSRDAPDGEGGTTHRILVLRRIDGHVAVANSPALEVIRPRWDDDALVDMDSGLLLEEPSLYLNEVLPATADDLDQAIRLACREAHAEGVTACGDYEQAPSHAALQRAAARGDLTVRVAISVYAQQLGEALRRGLRCGRRALGPEDSPVLPPAGSHDGVWPARPAGQPGSQAELAAPGLPPKAGTADTANTADTADGADVAGTVPRPRGEAPGSNGAYPQGAPTLTQGSSAFLHELGLKLFLDGSLGGNTAYLHEPYVDDPGNRGSRIWTDQQLDDMLWPAHAAGMTIHLHAIGDAAIDQALDAFERLRRRVDQTLAHPEGPGQEGHQGYEFPDRALAQAGNSPAADGQGAAAKRSSSQDSSGHGTNDGGQAAPGTAQAGETGPQMRDSDASGGPSSGGLPPWNHNARRHRIEHYELPTPEARRRTADLGIMASVQPNFVGAWSSKGGMYEARLGDRFYLNNLYRTFLEEGLELAFGSDGMPFGPRYGIQSAVEHPLTHERLSPAEAVYYYTNRAAWSIHLNDAGTLEVGKHADLLLLDEKDLDARPATQWAIRETVVAGETCWSGAVDPEPLLSPSGEAGSA